MKFVLMLCLFACAGGASAEKADALKNIKVVARTINSDLVSGLTKLSGKVELQRGTLGMTSEKADVQEAPDGSMFITLTTAPGEFATFRQKSDAGPDVWTEGRAQRIEYDEKTDVIKLFERAMVKTTDHGRIKNQVEGELLTFNERTQNFSAENNASSGRSTMIIAPHRALVQAQPALVETPAK